MEKIKDANAIEIALEPTEPTPDLVESSGPLLLTPAPVREVFGVESRFEDILTTQLETDHTALADIVELEASSTVRQRSNGNLRPDVLLNVEREDGDAEAVIELTLEALDQDHLQRGVLYAIENGASKLVYIAPSVSDGVLQLVRVYARALNVHISVLTLNTYLVHPGRYGYSFSIAFGGPEDVTSRTREMDMLELAQQKLRAMGNHSLDHVIVQRNGRIEWNPDGARYKLRAGKSSASISLLLRDKSDGTLARVTFNRMLRDMDVMNDAISHSVIWGSKHGRSKDGTQLSIRVEYGGAIRSLSSAAFETAATKIAQAYKEFHAATIPYV